MRERRRGRPAEPTSARTKGRTHHERRRPPRSDRRRGTCHPRRVCRREAEAAEAEIAERNTALDVPLNLRIDKDLDTRLKQQAAAAQIPTSALVRRLLRQAVHDPAASVLTVEQVEAIARRVVAESAHT